MTSVVEHILMYLLAFLVSSLEKCLFRSFLHFLIVFFFFTIELYEFLNTFWILTPNRHMAYKNLFPVHRLFFHFVDFFFGCKETF